MQPRTVCVPALKAVRDWGENRRCYGNLKKRKCAGYAVNFLWGEWFLKSRFPIKVQYIVLIIKISSNESFFIHTHKLINCVVFFLYIYLD